MKMEERPEHPFDELLDEDSAADSLDGRINPVKANFVFLKTYWTAKMKQLMGLKSKLETSGLTEKEFDEAKIRCVELAGIAEMVNEQYEKILPWEQAGLKSVTYEQMKEVWHLVNALRRAGYNTEKKEYEKALKKFDASKRSAPTSMKTVNLAKMASEACDLFAVYAVGEEKIEILEKKERIERYMRLERKLRYRYMPQLEYLERDFSRKPFENLDFLSQLFDNYKDATRQLNRRARSILAKGVDTEEEVKTLQECDATNEMTLALIYSIDENYKLAKMQGKVKGDCPFSMLRDGIIDTQVMIAEALRELR